MKSDVIKIDSAGNGFSDVMQECGKVARYLELSSRDALHLDLLAEEMLCLARSVTGELEASFWLENEANLVVLHMTTRTVMDREKRGLLISSSTSRKNDAARSFLGKLRDALEQAMVSDVDHQYYSMPADVEADVVNRDIDDQEWDGYERSTLRKLADDIRIGVRGNTVDITVSKRFAQ